MTNQQRQSSLDKQKWLESKKQKRDMSGDMPYCEYCDYEFICCCDVLQEARERLCLCAKAYNRMVRGSKNG